MSLNRNFFIAAMALSFLMVSGVKAQNAAPTTDNQEEEQASSDTEAILFRIENIEPIVNKDGLTDQCSYMMTVYNRTDKTVKNADLTLVWKDKIGDKYKIQGDEIKVASAEDAVRVITTDVSIDNIAPRTQKSFANKVATDRCYLLLDNVEFKVSSCVDEDAKNNNCASKFNYIDSKNPEYYSEFKDVPASVLAKQAEEEKERELTKVSDTIKSITETMDATEAELEKIK
ncbi:MAG: hypothetical protein IJ738_03160 [Alphaproteobacteria bacterium]|nr:hypothetical protein [Alphaproteobacteria bacterium]